MKKYLLLFFLLTTLVMCENNQPFKRTNNGAMIQTAKGAVLIEVINDSIIHCVASPDETVTPKQSKIVILPKGKTTLPSIKQIRELVVLETAKIKVKVNTQTGRIIYADKSDNIILSEPENGGRIFANNTINGDTTQSIQQQFLSEPDEALYELGQHQHRKLNIKGRYSCRYEQHPFHTSYW